MFKTLFIYMAKSFKSNIFWWIFILLTHFSLSSLTCTIVNDSFVFCCFLIVPVPNHLTIMEANNYTRTARWFPVFSVFLHPCSHLHWMRWVKINLMRRWDLKIHFSTIFTSISNSSKSCCCYLMNETTTLSPTQMDNVWNFKFFSIFMTFQM